MGLSGPAARIERKARNGFLACRRRGEEARRDPAARHSAQKAGGLAGIAVQLPKKQI